MADSTAQLLEILSRVEPLLVPDLAPSPPPSPRPPPVKRKLTRTPEPAPQAPTAPHARPPRPPPPRPPAPVAVDWRTEWPKERLRKLGAQCRDRGRELKHSGDSLARRSTEPATVLLALAHQLDAILLYVFAFWCDDAAAKTCLVQNWSSVFGLLAFVKKAAEKESQPFLTGICLRMEAIAIYTLSMHEQKALFYKATQLGSAPSASNPGSRPPRPPPPPAPASGPTPATTTTTTDNPSPASSSSATAPSPASQSLPLASHLSPSHSLHRLPSGSAPLPPPPPPPGPPPPPPPLPLAPPTSTPASISTTGASTTTGYEEFVQKFLRASPDLFRYQKLYDESCTLLVVVSRSRREEEGRGRGGGSATMMSNTGGGPCLVLPNPPLLSSLESNPSRNTGLGIITTSTGRRDEREEGELGVPTTTTTTAEADAGTRWPRPIELARGTGSTNSALMVPSQVGYCRALLYEWVEEKGLDYEFGAVGQGV